MLLVGDDFAELFKSFESSAFKMETLDFYDVDDEREEFRAFLAGEEIPKEWTEPNPWVLAMTGAGKSLRRVHVVRSPLSDYLKFELGWGYPANVQAGEDIRVLDLAGKDVTGLPDHDFWLFDDARVYRMHYNAESQFLGAEPLDESALPAYREYRDIALQHAESYESYWRQRPD